MPMFVDREPDLVGSSDADPFACGLDSVEPAGGGCIRLNWYSWRKDQDGVLEREVTLSFVVPADNMPAAILLMMREAGACFAGEIRFRGVN